MIESFASLGGQFLIMWKIIYLAVLGFLVIQGQNTPTMRYCLYNWLPSSFVKIEKRFE